MESGVGSRRKDGAMKIEVEMLAFEDGKIRVVDIPADEAEGASR